MKAQLKQWPEYLFSLSALVLWIMEGELWNPWILIFLGVFVQQLIWQNAAVGRTLAAITGLISIFFLLALVSELLEFQMFNSRAWELLLGGLLIIGSSLAASIFMMKKYWPNSLLIQEN